MTHSGTHCYASLEEGQLTVGTPLIERSWKLGPDGLIPLALTDRSKRTEWLDAAVAADQAAFKHLAFDAVGGYELRQRFDDEERRAPRHLLVELTAQAGSVDLKWQFRLYDDTPLIRQSVYLRKSAAAGNAARDGAQTVDGLAVGEAATNGNGVERKPSRGYSPAESIDFLPLAPLHCRWQTVDLIDVTDHSNNLVTASEGLLYTNATPLTRTGQLISFDQTLTGAGLLVIKESPARIGQLHEAGDFVISSKRLWVIGSGVTGQDLELAQGEWVEAYGCAIGVYAGGAFGKAGLMRRYHSCLQASRGEDDCYVMSNTWGDRSRDGRVTESFILQELDIAARLGITHVQIDDGWQKGATSNSVIPGGTWADYYSKHADFWDVHPERFPNGLESVAQRARELGIRLGLWFSPDSADEFTHWEADAAVLHRLWRDYGVAHFKLDGIIIASKLAESRFLRFMSQASRLCDGQLSFNLDTTSGRRLGYLYHTSYGNLFLENRYSDFRNYYPHWTLRNLWTLSPYVPASKLQIEFLNTDRNTGLYGDDPLAPAACGIGYSFAASMFASPLAWMELSGLSEAQIQTLQPLIALYNRLRPDLAGGHVLPVGAEPNGVSWTGLQCMTDTHNGYLLAFREWTDTTCGTFRLWGATGKVTLDCLVRSDGEQSISVQDMSTTMTETHDSDVVQLSLGRPHSFALYRYTVL